MVCEKIWSRYSWERPYLFFCKRGGSIYILGLPQQFLWVRLRILWAGLTVISNWIISQRNIVLVWDITASMRWRVSFSDYMSVSRSTANVDLVSMIGTIVFKGAECTSDPEPGVGEETIRIKKQPGNENDLEPSTTIWAGRQEATKRQLSPPDRIQTGIG